MRLEISTNDILLAPAIVITVIVLSQLSLSLFTQTEYWVQLYRKIRYGANVSKSKLVPLGELLSPREQVVFKKFCCYQNNPGALMNMIVPAMMSLLYYPATMYLSPVIYMQFWPAEKYKERPDVNEAIGCFLTPAGLIYAIAFGFAAQAAMQQLTMVSDFCNNRLSALHDLLHLIQQMGFLDIRVKMALLIVLKDEVISWMKAVLGTHGGISQALIKDSFRLMEVYQQAEEKMDSNSRYQNQLSRTFWEKLRVLKKSGPDVTAFMLRDCKGPLVNWFFLVFLGYVSFFGILCVKAESQALEVVMALLTVITICLFLCILADMDSPMHGFFRTPLQPFADHLLSVEKVYKSMLLEMALNAETKVKRQTIVEDDTET